MTRPLEPQAVDLLGKPLHQPRAPLPPFYCVACGNMHSKKCSRHGMRYCCRRGCALSGCEGCFVARIERQKRQKRALIAEAIAAVQALPEARLLQLGSFRGWSAEATRAELLTFAECEPRRALTAFAKGVSR